MPRTTGVHVFSLQCSWCAGRQSASRGQPWPSTPGLSFVQWASLSLCAAADAARRMALHSFWDELARRLDDSIDEPIRDDKAGGGGGHKRQSSSSSRPRLNSLGRAGSGKSGGSSDNVRAEVAPAGSAMRSFVRWRVRTQRCAAVPMFEAACIRAGVTLSRCD